MKLIKHPQEASSEKMILGNNEVRKMSQTYCYKNEVFKSIKVQNLNSTQRNLALIEQL